jgi:hypothetical protein
MSGTLGRPPSFGSPQIRSAKRAVVGEPISTETGCGRTVSLRLALMLGALSQRDHHATQGEFEAAQVLANAAAIISTQRAAFALRYRQTLLDMGSNETSTIVFPIPIDLIRPFAHDMRMATAGFRIKWTWNCRSPRGPRSSSGFQVAPDWHVRRTTKGQKAAG